MMKYYEIKSAITVNGEVPPGLNGEHVKNRELFFDADKCGPNRFYDQNYAFDYLVPMEYGEGREDEPSSAIYDYHSWLGESPWGGWLKPISKKFKDILDQFNLGEHRFYPARVLFNGQKHEYFILQILDDFYLNFLDFDKTIFNNLTSSRRLKMPEPESRIFNSISELETYSEKNWGWNYNYESIVMKPEFRNVDFATIYLLGDIVSERLKNAIEEAGLKGMEFEELPIPIEFSDEV